MAEYRRQSVSREMKPERLVRTILNGLMAGTSVEIFAEDDGSLELVIWLDRRVAWGSHEEVE